MLEDRVEIKVERFPDNVAEPGMTGGACLLPQGAVVVAHPLVRRHPGVLLRLRFGEPGEPSLVAAVMLAQLCRARLDWP